MKAWHITNWRLYEKADTRKTACMSWYAKQTKLIGQGIGRTLREPYPRNMTLLGVWNMIETLASQSAVEHRGWLVRNKTPLDAEGMAELLPTVPQSGFQAALDWFSHHRINWLELVECPFATQAAQETAGNLPGSSPGNLPPDSPTAEVTGTISRTDRQTDRQCTDRQTGGGGGGGGASGTGIEIPDDRLVFDFAEQFPGEPASGAPGMPRAWVEQWVAKMRGRERWPRAWQQKLVADWRVEFRGWTGEGEKKNAPAKNSGASRARDRWQVEKDLQAVRAEIAQHPKLTWPANKPLPAKKTAEFEALVTRRGELERELKAV